MIKKLAVEGNIMRVGIVDAELIGRKRHRFPNLACMKLSAYHKSRGDAVELVTDYADVGRFDQIYLSKVFTDTVVPEQILSLKNCICGGTGFYYDKAPPLPPEIEHARPDYHLYDDWVKARIAAGEKRIDYRYYLDYSIGFLTRGCFRGCKVCVNRNYKKVELHSPLGEFLNQERRRICLLDDNFFGSPEWKRLLMELRSTEKPFQFKQGLDGRLLTEEKCRLLFGCKYDGDYIFAFDDIEDYDLIEQKLKLIRRHTDVVLKFYVLCAFDRNDKWDAAFWKRDIHELWTRVELLMKYRCLPYIMRYNRYKESPYAGTYITMARWCNQPSLFKKLSYREYVALVQRSYQKPSAALQYMEYAQRELPDIAERFFDIKFPAKKIEEVFFQQ